MLSTRLVPGGLFGLAPFSLRRSSHSRRAWRHHAVCTSAGGPDPAGSPLAPVPRRAVLGSAALAAASAMMLGPAAQSTAALPLAPLGKVQHVGGDKRTGLSTDDVKSILERDLRDNQYFITGDLTLEIFADDCRFKDPTNDVVGLSRYKQALGILFDPQYSIVKLLDIQVTGPRQIEADFVLGGYLKFPWNPRVEPFEGHVVYTLNDEGLVQVQDQNWAKSAATALQESFTPTAGPSTDIVGL